ncbi:MAG: hypothetical protein M3137_10995 [Actinomycetota bacterium]|nr:hypothetical protein [Actinomycetota bacterium]
MRERTGRSPTAGRTQMSRMLRSRLSEEARLVTSEAIHVSATSATVVLVRR